MKRLASFALVVLILVAGVGTVGTPRRTTAQDDEAQATISALQTETARLQTRVAATSTTAAGAEDGEGEAGDSEKTVNVELILDSSGSMAEALDTGETRMEAAKGVLAGVVDAIPEREGVNVGLRVYGHEGDNSEEHKKESCESSELLVPMEGVDKDALRETIDAAAPTGWTPISLSLMRAAEDFPTASKDTTNAVVLITDGLETCGGRPARMAGRLQSGDKRIATHIVGFALTAEEQETIGAIADEGEGRLIGAQNAAELTEALFSILEELEIVAGRGFVGGNAFSLLPAGESGEVSVVAAGDLSSEFGGGIPVVVRNNTGEGVLGIQLNGTAYDANGDLIAVGRSVFRVAPRFVPPGTVAFGSVYFGNVQLPEDARFEFEAEATPPDRAIYPSLELDVAEASLFEDRVVGKLKNVGAQPITGPVSTAAVCFDLEGTLKGHYLGQIDVAQIAPGEDVPFQVRVFAECPAFLVAAA